MMWKNESFAAVQDGKRITFYEPLVTDAPAEAVPYCCHLSLVVRPGGGDCGRVA